MTAVQPKTTLDWAGEKVLAQVVAAAEKALTAGAIVMEDEVKSVMPGPGASVVPGTGGDTGIRGRYIASTRGTPPGIRSQRLQGSITTRERPGVRSIGTNLKYAKVHEFGGPINHPGGTPYIIVGPGRALFVSKEKAAELEGEGKTVRRTRPHTINMPKRPFMSVGFKRGRERTVETIGRVLSRESKKVAGL